MEGAQIRQGQPCGSLSVSPVASPSILALRLATESLWRQSRARRSFALLCPALCTHLSHVSQKETDSLERQQPPWRSAFRPSCCQYLRIRRSTPLPSPRNSLLLPPNLCKLLLGAAGLRDAAPTQLHGDATALSDRLFRAQRNVCRETRRYKLILRYRSDCCLQLEDLGTPGPETQSLSHRTLLLRSTDTHGQV